MTDDKKELESDRLFRAGIKCLGVSFALSFVTAGFFHAYTWWSLICGFWSSVFFLVYGIAAFVCFGEMSDAMTKESKPND